MFTYGIAIWISWWIRSALHSKGVIHSRNTDLYVIQVTAAEANPSVHVSVITPLECVLPKIHLCSNQSSFQAVGVTVINTRYVLILYLDSRIHLHLVTSKPYCPTRFVWVGNCGHNRNVWGTYLSTNWNKWFQMFRWH